MIFNKDNDGAKEIQTLVGTYFQSNDFAVIESEINSASRTIRKLIGPGIFDRAEKYYRTPEFTAQDGGIDSQLVTAIQTAIAQLAMVRFYQQNILSHEDGGRKVKIHEESEKMPWQWQYDRDDQALLDKYYRSLDELYTFWRRNRSKNGRPPRSGKNSPSALSKTSTPSRLYSRSKIHPACSISSCRSCWRRKTALSGLSLAKKHSNA